MQMRSRNPSRLAYQPDLLSPLHCVTNGHECLTQVEVRSDDPCAVIDVNHVAGEKKIVDERNHASISRSHWLPNGSSEIDTEVARGKRSIEQPA